MYKVSLSTKSFKFLKRSDPKLREALQRKINMLAQNPFDAALNVKKLKGREGYRLRVGDYRILYTVENNIVTIHIVDIAHRREVYQ